MNSIVHVPRFPVYEAKAPEGVCLAVIIVGSSTVSWLLPMRRAIRKTGVKSCKHLRLIACLLLIPSPDLFLRRIGKWILS